jgi:hypothetical protein
MPDISDSAIVSEAIIVWIGWRRFTYPHGGDDLVAECFGADAAADLVPIVRQLVDEFFSADAPATAKDLEERGDVAEAAFCRKHPDLSDDAIKALRWCYDFSNR